MYWGMLQQELLWQDASTTIVPHSSRGFDQQQVGLERSAQTSRKFTLSSLSRTFTLSLSTGMPRHCGRVSATLIVWLVFRHQCECSAYCDACSEHFVLGKAETIKNELAYSRVQFAKVLALWENAARTSMGGKRHRLSSSRLVREQGGGKDCVSRSSDPSMHWAAFIHDCQPYRWLVLIDCHYRLNHGRG